MVHVVAPGSHRSAIRVVALVIAQVDKCPPALRRDSPVRNWSVRNYQNLVLTMGHVYAGVLAMRSRFPIHCRVFVEFAVLLSFCGSLTAQDRSTVQAFDLVFRRISSAQQPPPNQPTVQILPKLQQKYELADGSMSALITAAMKYCDAVKPIDAEADIIISAARAQYSAPKDNRKGGKPVPPPPARLGELQKQKDALIGQSLADLSTAIGTAQLNSLTAIVMSQVTIQRAH